ncbi:hypothetical protein D3C71_1832820 [compost metagenome]
MRKQQILRPFISLRIEQRIKDIFGENDKQRQSDRQPAGPEHAGYHKGERNGQEQLDIPACDIYQHILPHAPSLHRRIDIPAGFKEKKAGRESDDHQKHGGQQAKKNE